ncbi:hypothetical protein BX666DRAFT_1886306 [Dichotomocladium elegans]|nr:hypothetical protein BX666DRAFT_1962449 [Dichotomocladium elegans]KAI9323387.1 hypothetical protein BX666DRAFT_1886306 [Dichotomocladium elegans]
MQPHNKAFSACSPSMYRMKLVNMKLIWSQANPEKVISSDESHFCRKHNDSGARVMRKKGE